MVDGARTHDRLDHNQELYQLSYNHQSYELFIPHNYSNPNLFSFIRIAMDEMVAIMTEPRKIFYFIIFSVLVYVMNG